MKKALGELFSSKKFLVMITAIIVYVTARVGWDVSPDQVNALLGVVAVWLLGQGIADHGKSAVVVKAEAEAALLQPPKS